MTDPMRPVSIDPPSSTGGDGGVVAASAAKQGGAGRRIVLILIAALTLTAIGFVVVGFGWKKPLESTNANDGKQAVDAAAFQNSDRPLPRADAPTTSTGEPTHPPTGEAPNVNAPVTSVAPSAP